MAKHDEELEKELQNPELQADAHDFDIGCTGCLVVLGICILGILLFLLISPGHGPSHSF